MATAALIAGGCGGEDEEPASPTTTAVGATGATGESGPLSKSQFTEAADAICAEAEASEEEQARDLFPNAQGAAGLSSEDFDRLATEVAIPSLRSQLEQLRALSPPEGDEEEVGEIISELEEGVEAVEEDPSLLADGGGPALQEATSLAQRYGLAVCGS